MSGRLIGQIETHAAGDNPEGWGIGHYLSLSFPPCTSTPSLPLHFCRPRQLTWGVGQALTIGCHIRFRLQPSLTHVSLYNSSLLQIRHPLDTCHLALILFLPLWLITCHGNCVSLRRVLLPDPHSSTNPSFPLISGQSVIIWNLLLLTFVYVEASSPEKSNPLIWQCCHFDQKVLYYDPNPSGLRERNSISSLLKLDCTISPEPALDVFWIKYFQTEAAPVASRPCRISPTLGDTCWLQCLVPLAASASSLYDTLILQISPLPPLMSFPICCLCTPGNPLHSSVLYTQLAPLIMDVVSCHLCALPEISAFTKQKFSNREREKQKHGPPPKEVHSKWRQTQQPEQLGKIVIARMPAST